MRLRASLRAGLVAAAVIVAMTAPAVARTPPRRRPPARARVGRGRAPTPVPCPALLAPAAPGLLAVAAAGSADRGLAAARRADVRRRRVRHAEVARARDAPPRHQGRLLHQRRLVGELASRPPAVPGIGEGPTRSAGGRGSGGSTSVASTCSVRSCGHASTCARGRASTASSSTTSTRYTNTTGFDLRPADQLRYDVFLANQAHRRGLSALLKNDLDQIPTLLPYFDCGAERAVLPVRRVREAPAVRGGRQAGVRRRVLPARSRRSARRRTPGTSTS